MKRSSLSLFLTVAMAATPTLAQVAVGPGAVPPTATGLDSTAVGSNAQATADCTTAVGANAQATEECSTAIGANATIQPGGVNGTAVGSGASAGADGTAVGSGANANFGATFAGGRPKGWPLWAGTGFTLC